MGKLFGTDGVRGVANHDLTPKMAFNLGKAAAYVLSKQKQGAPLFVVGKDTRKSGDMLEDALNAGILSAGGNVIRAGIIPTPAVAFLVKKYDADAGAVISASHNPYEYNGIKFFNSEGFKLSDSLEDEIEKIILWEMGTGQTAEPGKHTEAIEEALDLYVKHLLETFDDSLDGMKIVLDCANGAAYQSAPKVFTELGADVKVIGNNPDGVNINNMCGSTHPEKLQEEVLKNKADIGLAFDGDADRLIAVDEKGRVIDGDKVICICAHMLKDKGLLNENLVTGTVMSNLGFHKHIEALGCKTISTKVGDRYVLESMLSTGGVIGGEQSGHIIFLDYATTGDGTLAALQFVKAIMHFKKKASQLADEVVLYPQVLENAKIKNEKKHDYMEDEEIQKAIHELEAQMAGNGRVVIRPSGTEPVVRVMIEGNDIDEITVHARRLAKLIEQRLS